MSPFLLETQIHALPPGHPEAKAQTVPETSAEHANERFSYRFGWPIAAAVGIAASIWLLGMLL